MGLREEALALHSAKKGKIEVVSKVKLENGHDLSLAYTPGVAEPCKDIHADKEKAYEYTSKGNLVAVLTDGSRVLGLGNIGAEAAIPVMEGKAVLFKAFGRVDAFPICLATQDIEEIIKCAKAIAPVFGGINLEDIENPKCFEIEDRLKEELDIPVFHDDQHGTAIVALAAIINSLKVVGKKIESAKIVINGAGAAGSAIAKIIVNAGAWNLILVDSKGAIYDGRDELDPYKEELARRTNPLKAKGGLEEVIKGADVFIGVSKPNILKEDMVKAMAKKPIVFALCNPVPEIDPALAKKAGAAVVGTGRSDCANQINNVLAFPGVFRGALDVRARKINEAMKVAAAHAIAATIPNPTPERVVPDAFNKSVALNVALAVAKAAIETKVAKETDMRAVEQKIRAHLGL